MYKIDFELNVVLPAEISSTVILDNNKAIYDKINSLTGTNIIDGYLKLRWEKEDKSSWLVRLIGSGFIISHNDLREILRKSNEILYEDLKNIDKNIQIDIRCCHSVTLNFFSSLFILLKAKIQSMFRRLKQKFLGKTI